MDEQDDLQVESFAGWMLAVQLATSMGLHPGGTGLPLKNTTAAVSVVSASADTLMREALRAGKERLVIADSHGNVLASVWGEHDRVMATAEMDALLKRAGSNLTIYHNHQNDSTFSPADLELVLTRPGVAKSVIVTKKHTYEVSNVKPGAREAYNQESMNWGSRGYNIYQVTHKAMQALQKKGLVHYVEK